MVVRRRGTPFRLPYVEDGGLDAARTRPPSLELSHFVRHSQTAPSHIQLDDMRSTSHRLRRQPISSAEDVAEVVWPAGSSAGARR